MPGWILKQSTYHDRRPPPAANGLAAALRRFWMRLRWRWAAMAAAARAWRGRAR
jgi:hypothetical protein